MEMSAECVHMWAPSILDPESIEHEVELSNTTPHNVIKPLQSLFMRTHAHSECGLRSAEAFPRQLVYRVAWWWRDHHCGQLLKPTSICCC